MRQYCVKTQLCCEENKHLHGAIHMHINLPECKADRTGYYQEIADQYQARV